MVFLVVTPYHIFLLVKILFYVQCIFIPFIPPLYANRTFSILNVCAPLVFVLFQEKYHKDFLFLLFLIMSGAAAAQLGYLNLLGLDRLKSGPARLAASSLG